MQIENSIEMAKAEGVDHQQVFVKAQKILDAAQYIVSEKKDFIVTGLSDEGQGIVDDGKSPEFMVTLPSPL